MDGSKKTDWTAYYRTPFPAAGLLRRITGKRLVRAMRQCGILRVPGTVLELGGGGSSFAVRIARNFPCLRYAVIDSCPEGLARFRALDLPCRKEEAEADLLRTCPDMTADFVFSAGLIEHFSGDEIRRLIRLHFDMTVPGGFTAFLFPADTFLYRTVRAAAERFGMWRFPDERALTLSGVSGAAGRRPVREEMIFSILLTQGLQIYQKESEGK